jgi:hypothetical protein
VHLTHRALVERALERLEVRRSTVLEFGAHGPNGTGKVISE